MPGQALVALVCLLVAAVTAGGAIAEEARCRPVRRAAAEDDLLIVESGRGKVAFVLNAEKSGAAAASSAATAFIDLLPAERAPTAEDRTSAARVGRVLLSRSLAGSALVSFPDEDVRIGTWTGDGWELEAVARVANGRASLPLGLAVISSAASPSVELSWMPPPHGSDDARMDLLALEQLYRLALQQRPDQRFAWRIAGEARGHDDISQAAALEAIAVARSCAAAAYVERSAGRGPVPWEIARLEALNSTIASDVEIGVRATGNGGMPIEGVPVTFSRGTHSLCSTTTDGAGIARCKLLDAHGHAEDEPDEEQAATIATFAGRVTPERIVLPTTAVWAPTSGATTRGKQPLSSGGD